MTPFASSCRRLNARIEKSETSPLKSRPHTRTRSGRIPHRHTGKKLPSRSARTNGRSVSSGRGPVPPSLLRPQMDRGSAHSSILAASPGPTVVVGARRAPRRERKHQWPDLPYLPKRTSFRHAHPSSYALSGDRASRGRGSQAASNRSARTLVFRNPGSDASDPLSMTGAGSASSTHWPRSGVLTSARTWNRSPCGRCWTPPQQQSAPPDAPAATVMRGAVRYPQRGGGRTGSIGTPMRP